MALEIKFNKETVNWILIGKAIDGVSSFYLHFVGTSVCVCVCVCVYEVIGDLML